MWVRNYCITWETVSPNKNFFLFWDQYENLLWKQCKAILKSKLKYEQVYGVWLFSLLNYAVTTEVSLCSFWVKLIIKFKSHSFVQIQNSKSFIYKVAVSTILISIQHLMARLLQNKKKSNYLFDFYWIYSQFKDYSSINLMIIRYSDSAMLHQFLWIFRFHFICHC